MLDPDGYKPSRSKNELIAGLRRSSTNYAMRRLQDIRGVRGILENIFRGFADDRSDNRFLCGYEDGHWLLLGLSDPPIRALALNLSLFHLRRVAEEGETKQGLKSRTPLPKSLLRAWPVRE